MRQVLEAYGVLMRDKAMEAYRFATLEWALLAPHQKRPSKHPKLPRLLKDR